MRLGPGRFALICLATLAACSPHVSRAALSLAPCASCDVLLGVGTTFRTFAWTDGLVLPITLELDESRWELGAFRFATAQRAPVFALPSTTRAANPYWGFNALRRWQVLHRGRGRLYLGFGANYRTELDYLEATRWNFAYLVAVRFDLDRRHQLLELGVRHWSDAWIRPPNRGQNLITLSFGF
jgi:Lipid A 3-O-deacylase (PagL)